MSGVMECFTVVSLVYDQKDSGKQGENIEVTREGVGYPNPYIASLSWIRSRTWHDQKLHSENNFFLIVSTVLLFNSADNMN